MGVLIVGMPFFQFDFLFDPEEKMYKTDPHGIIMSPVYTKIEENPTLAGIAVGVTPFGNLLDRLLPDGVDGVIGILKDNCDNVMSFELSSGKARFLGYVDAHEKDMENYERSILNLEMYGEIVEGLCAHDLYIYPTAKLMATYETNGTGIFVGVVAVSLSLIAIFVFYDNMVTKRQKKTLQAALRNRAIVTSLFPEQIARRLVADSQSPGAEKKQGTTKSKSKFEGYLDQESVHNEALSNSKPLAELFPEATIMFGDLVGFTAWSSQREPHQVFRLLETIYASFDKIAVKRGIFKVETIGDCYVAVCGVPNPRKDHALNMSRK